MMDPEKIWQGWPLVQLGEIPGGGDKLRTYHRLQTKRRDQLKVLELIYERNQGLVEGDPGIKISESKAFSLLKLVGEGCDGYTLKRRHNFVVRGLSRGNNEGLWDIPVPAPIVILRREPSPFTPEKFQSLQALKQVYCRFEGSLSASFFEEDTTYLTHVKIRKGSPTVTTKQLQAGQILYSAIVNGALLNRKWLTRLGDAISNRVIAEDNNLWLDLVEPSDSDEEPDVVRRWFPDPLTGLLILRWRKLYGNTWPEETPGRGSRRTVDFLLARYLSSLQLNANQRPGLYQLVEAASTRLSLQLPQFMIHYARSDHTAPSLKPLSWARLRLNRRGIQEDSAEEPGDNTYTQTLYRSQRLTHYPDQLQKLRHLQRLLSKYHYKTAPRVGVVCKSIDQYLQTSTDLSPLIEALVQWSLCSMRSTVLSGTKLKPSSMSNYLSSIGSALVSNATDVNIMDLSVNDWDHLYNLVLERAPTEKNRHYKARRLISFHRFMMHSYQVQAVDIECPYGSRGLADSNIISPKEYSDILATLSIDITQSERLRRIQRLLIILGYRCGLRRNETLTLQIRDLQDEQETMSGCAKTGLRPELIIRNNLQGTVKTTKSIRRLPISLLLTDSEREELRAWKQQRQTEIAGEPTGNQLLFCHLAEDLITLHDKETFLPIHDVIRHVTGDKILIYHHLRHSFASILFLQLLEDDYPGVLPATWSSYKYVKLLPLANESIRSQLLLQPKGSPTRKWLYALGQLLGHIDPKETMDTYLHLLDWAKGYALQKNSPVLSLQMQAALTGLTAGSLKVWRSRLELKGETSATDLFQLMLKKQVKQLRDPVIEKTVDAKPVSHKAIMLPAFSKQTPTPFLLYEIFRQHRIKQSNAWIAQRFGFLTQKIKQWIRTAKILGALCSDWGKPRHTRRYTLNTSEFVQLPRKPNLQGLSPAPPRHRGQPEIALQVYNSIVSAYDVHTEVIEKGLRVFLNRGIGSSSRIKIIRETELLNHIRMLKVANIPRNRINIRLYPSKKSSSPSSPAYWAKLLDTPRYNIVAAPALTQKDRARAILHICAVPRNKKQYTIKSDSDNKAASGLRFGLFMAAVYLDIHPTLDIDQLKIKQLEIKL